MSRPQRFAALKCKRKLKEWACPSARKPIRTYARRKKPSRDKKLRIHIKQYTGVTVSLYVSPKCTVQDVLDRAFRMRVNEEVPRSRWMKHIRLANNEVLRMDPSFELGSIGVRSGMVFREMPSSFVTAYNADRALLSCVDPVTFEESVYPCVLPCGHVAGIETFIRCAEAHPFGDLQCPLCKKLAPTWILEMIRLFHAQHSS